MIMDNASQELGALRVSNGDNMSDSEHDIPISDMAYYVVLRLRMPDPLTISQALVGGSLPEPRYRALLSARATVNITSMLFGLPPPEARQVLLERSINRALSSRDSQSLKQLLSDHPRGFLEVLNDIASNTWASGATEELCSAAYTLAEGGLLARFDPVMAQSISKRLAHAFYSLPVWQKFGLTLASGVNALLDICVKFDCLETGQMDAMIRLIAACPMLTAGGGESESNEAADSWRDGLTALTRHLADLHLEHLAEATVDAVAVRLGGQVFAPFQSEAALRYLYEVGCWLSSARERSLQLLGEDSTSWVMRDLPEAKANRPLAWCVFLLLDVAPEPPPELIQQSKIWKGIAQLVAPRDQSESVSPLLQGALAEVAADCHTAAPIIRLANLFPGSDQFVRQSLQALFAERRPEKFIDAETVVGNWNLLGHLGGGTGSAAPAMRLIEDRTEEMTKILA